MKPKELRGKGVVDYDYKNDILFFKIDNREYAKSIEFDNLVIDIDKEGFIVGIQIMEASDFLNVSKIMLTKIPQWQFRTKVHEGHIEIRLEFQTARNKIIHITPIAPSFAENFEPTLPNSEVLCDVKA